MLVKTGDKPTETEINADFNYDITLTKNLEIYKVDSRDEKLPLVGVGFVLQNKDTNKYVKQTNGILSYVDNRSEATEFMTDSNGKIKFENLIMGTYVAYETKNPNYGYEIIKDGITIKNIQKYIKLSGYIWKDVQSGKQTVRNDLYKDDEYDVNDESFNGITVRLKDKDGNKYFAHTLNNTVVAPPRMLIAFLENNLNEDGSINIPEALQPYMDGTKILMPKK